jgi:hypothetical protein
MDSPPDPHVVNIASAELSGGFFIAAQSSAREIQYADVLSRRAQLLKQSEIREIIAKVLPTAADP